MPVYLCTALQAGFCDTPADLLWPCMLNSLAWPLPCSSAAQRGGCAVQLLRHGGARGAAGMCCAHARGGHVAGRGHGEPYDPIVINCCLTNILVLCPNCSWALWPSTWSTAPALCSWRTPRWARCGRCEPTWLARRVLGMRG